MACKTIDRVDPIEGGPRHLSHLTLIDAANCIPVHERNAGRPRPRPAHYISADVNRRLHDGHPLAKRAEGLVLTAGVLVALAAMVFGVFGNGSARSPQVRSLHAVTIAPGDTIWSVASRSAAPGQSVVGVIAEIRAANPQLSQGAPVHVGERILTP